MKTPHPHAEILKSFIEDTSVDIEYENAAGWDIAYPAQLINDIHGVVGFRLKPAVRSITLQDGTVLEWPEPMRVAPADGQFHWQTHSGEVRRSNWCGSNYQAELLKTGFCHLTKEAAQQHRRAIVLANGGEL